MGSKKSHDIFLPERLGFVARSKAISVAPVVQKMYSAIDWINCYPVDTVRKTNCAIQWSGPPRVQWIEIFTCWMMDGVINLLNNWDDIRSQLANQFQTIQCPKYKRYMFGFGSKDLSAWSMSESTVTKVPPWGRRKSHMKQTWMLGNLEHRTLILAWLRLYLTPKGAIFRKKCDGIFVFALRTQTSLVFLWHKGRNFRAITGLLTISCPYWF